MTSTGLVEGEFTLLRVLSGGDMQDILTLIAASAGAGRSGSGGRGGARPSSVWAGRAYFGSGRVYFLTPVAAGGSVGGLGVVPSTPKSGPSAPRGRRGGARPSSFWAGGVYFGSGQVHFLAPGFILLKTENTIAVSLYQE